MWSFLNPMFLWALCAAVIPLIVHLLARRRTVRIPFSTLKFLKLAQKKSSSRVKLENFLLWLVRTLLLLVLALAFALPVIRLNRFGGFMGVTRRDVAIVWDVSFSMGYESGRKKVWEDSKALVRSILDGLSPNDRVCLYLAGDTVQPLVPVPIGDLDLVKAQIAPQTPGFTSSRLLPALQAAIDALKKSDRPEREVYIVTDGQALPWADFGGEAPEPDAAGAAGPGSTPPPAWNPKSVDRNTSFFVATLGAAVPENLTTLKVEVQPSLVMAGAAATVKATLGFTGPARDVPVSLYVDDREVSRQTARMTASSAPELVFALPPLSAGPHAVRVAPSEDALPVDNAFHVVVRAKDRLPVLCVGAESDLAFLKRALNPSERTATAEVEVAAPDSFMGGNLSRYATVFLCNALPLAGQGMMEVEQYVRAGGLLVVFPGNKGSAADYAGLACRPGESARVEELDPLNRRRQLRLVKPTDPVFATMKLPPGSVPTLAITRQLRWEPPYKDAETVLAGDDGAPFLVSRPFGKGRALSFSVSADRSWSTLPLSPFFLPMIHRIVQFGAGLNNETPFVWSSRDLALADAMPEAAGAAELRTPSGNRLLVRRVLRDNRESLQVENVLEPGFYAAGDGAANALLAVNVPRSESNLGTIDDDGIRKRLGLGRLQVARDREELARLVEEHRVGRPFGETLLWLALLLSLLEVFLASRASRRRSLLTDTMTIAASGRVHAAAAPAAEKR